MFRSLTNMAGVGANVSTPAQISAFRRLSPAKKRERIRQLWQKLRVGVMSGMAGWLCRHAQDGVQHDEVEAQSVRDVIFPKFSIGDTLELPSRVIPFVGAARFLRGYLSGASSLATAAGSGGGGGDAAAADDARRTIACKLMLSKHGVGTLMSAFWFVVLRRFRWHVEDPNDQSVSSQFSGAGLNTPTPTTQHHQHGGSPVSASATTASPMPQRTPSAASTRAPPHHPPPHHDQHAHRPPSAFSNASTTRTRSAMSSVMSNQQQQQQRPVVVDADAKRYAQGLLFNAAFHFSQIYANHGSEIRTAATLQLFCQLFSATLLNFIKTEFWDAADDVSAAVADEEEAAAAAAGSTSGSGLSPSPSSSTFAPGHPGAKRRRSPDGRRDVSKRPRYLSASGADGSETLERYVGGLSIAWFFGDNVVDALQGFFAADAFHGGSKSALEGASQTALAHEERGNSSSSSTALAGGSLSNSIKHLDDDDDDDDYDDEGGDAGMSVHERRQQRAAEAAAAGTAGRRSRFAVPARHQMDAFLRAAREVEAAVATASSSSAAAAAGSPQRASAPAALGRMRGAGGAASDDAAASTDARGGGGGELEELQLLASSPVGAAVAYSGVPLKLEGRRSHELLAQQRRNRQQGAFLPGADDDNDVGGRSPTRAGSASPNRRRNKDGAQQQQKQQQQQPLSSLEQIRQQQAEEEQRQLRAGAPKRVPASEVTDRMEVLMHTKDGRSSIRKEDPRARKRAAFHEGNRLFLEYCRARLRVQGVSVDEMQRRVPFPLSTRSQLLQLAEVLAAHNVGQIGRSCNPTEMLNQSRAAAAAALDASGNDTSLLSASLRRTPATLHDALHMSTRGGASARDTGMTNAFTPRPEASLQLNTKDAARRAGYDSTRKPTRCPFCHPHPHALELNVAAMKYTRQAEKAAAKCRSCFEVKSGVAPTMTCSRCRSVLCADCIKVIDVPVVETVLMRAAMSAATRSFNALVSQLWGGEIADTVFGPIMPLLTKTRHGANLDDLGAALTPLPSVKRAAAHESPGQQRPASCATYRSMNNSSNSGSSSVGGKTPLGVLKRDQRRQDQVLLEQLYGSQRRGGVSDADDNHRGVPPSDASPSLPALRSDDGMMPQDSSGGVGVFNLTEASASRPPSSAARPPRQVQRFTAASSLDYGMPTGGTGTGSMSEGDASRRRGASALDRVPRPGSSMSCCSWMAPGHLQGKIMRTGGRIDAEVFAADDPAEQHASGISAAWRQRHMVRMTRTPNLDSGNLGRLRGHIQRSLEHARQMVAQAVADTARERAETAQLNRRLKEMSSRDMISQFRAEAHSASQRLNGGARDEHAHRRAMAGEVASYASRFAGTGTAIHNAQLVETAEHMLDTLARNPSLGMLSAAARRRILDFIVHERHSIFKAQVAAQRLQELLSWSQAQGSTLTLEELIASMELDEAQVLELRTVLGIKSRAEQEADTAALRRKRRQQQQREAGGGDDDDGGAGEHDGFDAEDDLQFAPEELERQRAAEAAADDFERDVAQAAVLCAGSNVVDHKNTSKKQPDGGGGAKLSRSLAHYQPPVLSQARLRKLQAAAPSMQLTQQDVPPPAPWTQADLQRAETLVLQQVPQEQLQELTEEDVLELTYGELTAEVLNSVL